MKHGRLSLRVDSNLLKQMRRISKEKGVTITALVEDVFRTMVAAREAERVRQRILGNEPDPPEAEQIP